MKKYPDVGSTIVIIITFFVFLLALFIKGFSHDILLELGVFLVSVKLIIMAHKISVSDQLIEKKVDEIKKLLEENSNSLGTGDK